jgi:methionyl-tRNA formyltransferase
VRSVFFGTPAIAVPALRALAEISELVGVVCQPDRPAGRGLTLAEPAIKVAARELGIEAHQPAKVKTGNLHEWLAERRVDVALVLAYGRILPAAVLGAPRAGCLNLHASLLPKYRGAAPINWAIAHGEHETGISLMQMDEGLDTGPVYTKHVLTIGAAENAGELALRLAALAADVVRQDVRRVVAGELTPAAQEHALATHAPPILREHTLIDWRKPAIDIVNLVRAMAPRPGASTRLRGKNLRILAARALAPGARAVPQHDPLPPGEVRVVERNRLWVGAGHGSVELSTAQLEGKKPLSATDLINGRALKDGDVLSRDGD